MTLQPADLSRIRATYTHELALGIERTHLRNELFELCRKLNVAEPWQMKPLADELDRICRLLRQHTEQVVKAFEPKEEKL